MVGEMISFNDVYLNNSIRKTAIRIIKKCPGIYGMIKVDIKANFEVGIPNEPNLCYEVPNEFVFYIEHEKKHDKGDVHVSFELTNELDIEAILVEKDYIQFEKNGNHISFKFDISGFTGSTTTLSIHTRIEEPGLKIRLEHNHIGRKAGMYRNINYPGTQIIAAHHYIMGMREIIRMLNLPSYLANNNLGYMYILGFETNNEIHTDYPPHWHLIYRWETFVGSQAPHLYLGENGETLYNKCYIDGIEGVCRTFKNGEWCKFVDYLGTDVCALCVKDDGVFVTKPYGDVYHMSNFEENKVVIKKNDVKIGEIEVADDVKKGIYEIKWTKLSGIETPESYIQKIIYDPLTGVFFESHVHNFG